MYKLYRHAGLSSPAFFFAAALAIWLMGWSAGAQSQAMLLPTSEITIGPHTVRVEIAATDASRAKGLMGRTSLPADHGMLFVFAESTSTCFWMKNTPLPLTIAFIDAQGLIVNMADMQAHSLDTHCPTAPFTYALEMEQGWFTRHRIKAGAKVANLPAL